MAIKRVWIEEGCIQCNACESDCPTVFHVDADSSTIRADVRVDGLTSTNRTEKAELKADLQTSLEKAIQEAAAACPMEVIHFE